MTTWTEWGMVGNLSATAGALEATVRGHGHGRAWHWTVSDRARQVESYSRTGMGDACVGRGVCRTQAAAKAEAERAMVTAKEL